MNSSVVFASILIGDIFAGFSWGRALSGVGFSAIYRAMATRLLAITRGGFLFSCKIGTGGVGRGRFFLAAEWHWGSARLLRDQGRKGWPRSGRNSPRPLTKSPRSGRNSPIPFTKSPRSDAHSPVALANLPMSGVNSSGALANLPMSGVNSSGALANLPMSVVNSSVALAN